MYCTSKWDYIFFLLNAFCNAQIPNSNAKVSMDASQSHNTSMVLASHMSEFQNHPTSTGGLPPLSSRVVAHAEQRDEFCGIVASAVGRAPSRSGPEPRRSRESRRTGRRGSGGRGRRRHWSAPGRFQRSCRPPKRVGLAPTPRTAQVGAQPLQAWTDACTTSASYESWDYPTARSSKM